MGKNPRFPLDRKLLVFGLRAGLGTVEKKRLLQLLEKEVFPVAQPMTWSIYPLSYQHLYMEQPDNRRF
jgi:hypothetical protein